MAWRRGVHYVQPGEGVRAAVVSRPDRELSDRFNELHDRVDASDAGKGLYRYDETVDASVNVGEAVYYNTTTNQFELAIASPDVDTVSAVLQPSDAAYVSGIVVRKSSSTLADILLWGFGSIDLTNSVDDPEDAGMYYLSSLTAGKLTKQKPAVTVPVLFNFGDGTVLFYPQPQPFLSAHEHVRFELLATTAGTHTPPAEGDPHEIADPDNSLPGWLPADDAIFDGAAPSGAVFGYNISQDESLRDYFPPVPLRAAAIFWDRGDDYNGGLIGDEYCVVTAAGIWWMTDCYGRVPWDVDLDTTSDEEFSGEAAECPTPTTRVTLAFHLPVFRTDENAVTSLVSRNDFIKVVRQGTDTEASSGKLELVADLDLSIGDTSDEEGAIVVKSIEDMTAKRGYVTEAIAAGTNVVINESTHSFTDGDDVEWHQGRVVIDVPKTSNELVVDPRMLRLNDTKDRLFSGVPGIGFTAGRESTLLITYDIPATDLPTNPKFKIRFTLVSLAAGTFPDLTVTYIKLTNTTTPEDIPSSSDEIGLTTGQTVTADQYFSVESDSIDVTAGDKLIVTVLRSDDVFDAEIGVLFAPGIVYAE